MSLSITAFYAGLLALLYVALTARTILYRRSQRISLGAGESDEMLKRMRVHANFTENTPIGLILLALVEMQQAPVLAVHLLGLMLLIGRLMHAYGVSQSPQIMALRVGGMGLSLTMIGLAALGLILHGLL